MRALTLLLPPLRRIRESECMQTLAQWQALGDRLPLEDSGRDAALRSCFEFIGTEVPHAALTHVLDGHGVEEVCWVRADPAFVMADAVTLRMLACGTLDLSAAESEELCRPLRILFGDAGFPLEAAHPQRWYLRCPRGARLPRFAPPDAVLGDDLGAHLPHGDNERQWRHLLNEAQVILHNHPVNARRIERGLMPANSVWFWGAGVLPEWVRSTFEQVLSRDDVACALAQLAKIPVGKPAGAIAGDATRVLLDLADEREGAELEANFLAPLGESLHRRDFGEVVARFEDGPNFAFRPAHRWRFWRRVKPLHPA
jgi:hypothetical protein